MDGIKGLSDKLLASVREVLKTNQHLPRNEDLLKIASVEEMKKLSKKQLAGVMAAKDSGSDTAEELSPKQKKIASLSGDKNKIDSSDLAKLRKKIKPFRDAAATGNPRDFAREEKEEVEEVEEAIKSSRLDRAIRKYVPGAGKKEAKKRKLDYTDNVNYLSTSRPGYPHHDDNMKELGRSRRAAAKYKKMSNEEDESVDEEIPSYSQYHLRYGGKVGPKTFSVITPGYKDLGNLQSYYHHRDLHRLISKQNPNLEHHEVSAIVNSDGDRNSKQKVEHKGKTYTHHVVNQRRRVVRFHFPEPNLKDEVSEESNRIYTHQIAKEIAKSHPNLTTTRGINGEHFVHHKDDPDGEGSTLSVRRKGHKFHLTHESGGAAGYHHETHETAKSAIASGIKIVNGTSPKVNEEQVDEVLGKGATAADYIHDFVNSKNPKFDGKSKKERIRMALGAAYAARNDDADDTDEVSEKALGFKQKGNIFRMKNKTIRKFASKKSRSLHTLLGISQRKRRMGQKINAELEEKEMDVIEPAGPPSVEHQLRKSVSLRGMHPVAFENGETHKVPLHVAKHATNMIQDTPIQHGKREAFIKKLNASPESFYKHIGLEKPQA